MQQSDQDKELTITGKSVLMLSAVAKHYSTILLYASDSSAHRGDHKSAYDFLSDSMEVAVLSNNILRNKEEFILMGKPLSLLSKAAAHYHLVKSLQASNSSAYTDIDDEAEEPLSLEDSVLLAHLSKDLSDTSKIRVVPSENRFVPHYS